eukprot:m.204345 g.204345  ORF g.204345 m.204345 type:complete len:265 (-) comp53865_c0_seq5:134-928(-)
MFGEREVEQLRDAVRAQSLAQCQQLVLKCGPDIITTQDRHGWTALHRAVTSDTSLEILMSFLQHHVEINSLTKGGWTPLMYAAFDGASSCARALLECGANSRLKTQARKTALDIARDCNRSEVVTLLEGSLRDALAIPTTHVFRLRVRSICHSLEYRARALPGTTGIADQAGVARAQSGQGGFEQLRAWIFAFAHRERVGICQQVVADNERQILGVQHDLMPKDRHLGAEEASSGPTLSESADAENNEPEQPLDLSGLFLCEPE